MRVCNKCQTNTIPATIKIDGKTRNLKNRKYCLDCSPFGQHNTSKLEINKEKRVCEECGREYRYQRRKGHRLMSCNSCYQKNRRIKIKQLGLKMLGGRCSRCGYDKDARLLHFHHLDPSTKLFTISGSHCRSFEAIKKEIQKCILLCGNCHQEVHYSNGVSSNG